MFNMNLSSLPLICTFSFMIIKGGEKPVSETMCIKHYLCIANASVLYILKLPCRNLSLYKSLLDSRSKDTYISWHEENGTCPFSNSTHTYLII